jgi:hypothetical protein
LPGADLRVFERLIRGGDGETFRFELLELEPALPILPHGVGAEGELVLDQRKREIDLAALLRPAADRELGGFLAAVEDGALGVEVERAAGPARAVEDGVGPAADIGAVHVEPVVGEDAAVLDHVGQVVAGDNGFGKTADRGAHVPRLREPAGRVGAIVVGAGGELEHVGDVFRADVVQEFLREHGDRGRGVEERRVHARAGKRVGRAVAVVALGRDEEGRELDGVARRRRVGGGSSGSRGRLGPRAGRCQGHSDEAEREQGERDTAAKRSRQGQKWHGKRGIDQCDTGEGWGDG